MVSPLLAGNQLMLSRSLAGMALTIMHFTVSWQPSESIEFQPLLFAVNLRIC